MEIFGISPDGRLPVERFWLPSEQTRSQQHGDGGGVSCVIYFKQKDTSADASQRQADTETLTNHMTCGHRPGRAPDAIAAHACGHHHFQKLYAAFICQIRLQLNTSISDSFSLFNI